MTESNILTTLANHADAVNEVGGPPQPPDLSLEELILLIHTNKINTLEASSRTELQQLQERQGQVRFLHKLLTGINSNTDSSGGFSCTNDPDMQQLLTQAEEIGVDLDPTRTKYTQAEKERLVENLRLQCEDLNVQNELQLQTITRLTNERYEMYQMARSILKPLHEDKINKARSASGR